MKRWAMRVNRRVLGIVVGLVLMASAGWAILRSNAGLTREMLTISGISVEWMRPAGDEPLPAVVLIHGFAGSHQTMGALARTFARAGYATASLELAGHGQSQRISPRSGNPDSPDLGAVIDHLRGRSDMVPGRIAVLGHSTGAGAAIRYAMAHPEIRATLAISPPCADVHSDSPRNLLILVGASEPQSLRETAMAALVNGGGSAPGSLYGDVANGTGRRLIVVPRAKHFTILFSRRTLTECVAWLDAALGPGARDAAVEPDVRVWWALMFCVGALVLFYPLAQLIWRAPRVVEEGTLLSRGQVLVITLIAGGATFLLMRYVPWRFPHALIADALGPFFLVYGLVVGFVVWRSDWVRWGNLSRPSIWRLAVYLLLSLLYLGGTVGVMSHLTLFNLVPAGRRIGVVGTLVAMLLPYFILDELLVRSGRVGRTWLYWLTTKLGWFVALGLSLASGAMPETVRLILPELVILMLLGGYLSDSLYRVCGNPLVGAMLQTISLAWVVGLVGGVYG